jgi:hypothetical protein
MTLTQRVASNVEQNSDFYQIQGYIGDGLYSEATIGSANQTILFSIDTSVSSIIINDANSTETLPFNQYRSTTFLNNSVPFNITTLFNTSALGYEASDYLNIFTNNNLSSPLWFDLAYSNTIGLKNKNIVEKRSQKIVLTSSSDSDTSKIAPNVLGLSLEDNPISLLNQLIQNNISSTRLFSLYFQDDVPVIDFGAINTAKYYGDMYVTPILKTSNWDTPSDTSYKQPFVALTGLSLINNAQNVSLSISNQQLSIPTLLDTSSVLSYLPYSLLVDLASQFGATYSTEHSLWIQSCSFQNVNGSIAFDFYDLTITVPLSNLVIPLVNSNGSTLYFESGDQACALAFSSSNTRGFSSLGTPFFKAAFTTFDYDNKMIGLAQREDSASEDTLVRVDNQIGGAVYATSMTNVGKFPPTAVIVPPSADVTQESTGSSLIMYPDHFLTVSPVVSSIVTQIPTPTVTTLATPTTQNANAVAVTSGPFFEAKASHTMKLCPGLAVLSALCIFSVLIECV